MIHKIHTGEASQDATWSYYGYGGTNPLGGAPLERATFPGNRMHCDQCHSTNANGTSKFTYALPLASSVAATSQSQTFTCPDTNVDPVAGKTTACSVPLVASAPVKTPATTAICTSCHDATYTIAHTALNTWDDGAGNKVESCNVCHASGTEFDVKLVHVQ